MSDNELPEPGVEINYMADGEEMHTAVIIHDPDRLRAIVSTAIQWIPVHQGTEGSDQPLSREEVEARVESGAMTMMPIMVVQHMPAHMPREEAVDHIEHQMYLVGQEDVINMVGTGINMFTQDQEMTDQIMHMLQHIISGEPCEGHEDDDD